MAEDDRSQVVKSFFALVSVKGSGALIVISTILIWGILNLIFGSDYRFDSVMSAVAIGFAVAQIITLPTKDVRFDAEKGETNVLLWWVCVGLLVPGAYGVWRGLHFGYGFPVLVAVVTFGILVTRSLTRSLPAGSRDKDRRIGPDRQIDGKA